MDRLRTAFVHAPHWVRKAASPILTIIPQQLLYGSTYRKYRRDISRSRIDEAFTRQWQTSRLRELLVLASQRAPHYRSLTAHLALTKADLLKFEVADLSRFPILSKEQLRAGLNDFITQPPAQLDAVSTSGSSGRPLLFYLDKDRSAKEWAFVLDAWAKIGLSAKQTRAVFRGTYIPHVDGTPWEFHSPLRELRLSPFHLTNSWMTKYCDLIMQFNATYLYGYPSALAIFAAHVLREGRHDVATQIQGAATISEVLLDHQRELIAHTFNTKNIGSSYGMSEKVAFGSELPGQPGVFEIEPLYGITELIADDGKPVTMAGEQGRIVSTGLLFRGMPLVRYDTGDLAELVEAPDPRNFYRLVVRNIRSRWVQEFLVGADHRLISTTAITFHSPAYSKMQAFQFFQDAPGRAVIKVVPVAGCGMDEIRLIIREISRNICSSIYFEIELVEKLDMNDRGKTKFIDQKLNLAGFKADNMDAV
jgi:phenylacetate-CoA ligase